MDDKNDLTDRHLEILKHLSTINRNIHESRIDRELRVVVIVVTFFIVLAYLKISGQLPSEGILFFERIHLSFLDLILIVSIWVIFEITRRYLKTSAETNDINQDKAERAEDIMALYLPSGDDVISYHHKKNVNTHPARKRCWLQFVLILSAAIICTVIILYL